MASCQEHDDIFPMVITGWNTRPIEDVLRAERDAALADVATLMQSNAEADELIGKLKAEVERLQTERAPLVSRLESASCLCDKYLEESTRLRAALEKYANPKNWDDRGGWPNCFFNFGQEEGPDIAREALEAK